MDSSCPYCASSNSEFLFRTGRPFLNAAVSRPPNGLDKYDEFEIRRCYNCELIYRLPQWTKEEFLLYEKSCSHLRPSDGLGSSKYERSIEYVCQYFPKSGKILEIGSLDGYVVDRLRKEGFNIDGVDIHYNGKLFDRNVKVNATSFVLIHTIEHLLDLKGVFSNLVDHLSSDGYILVETPNARSIQSQHQWYLSRRFLCRLAFDFQLEARELYATEHTIWFLYKPFPKSSVLNIVLENEKFEKDVAYFKACLKDEKQASIWGSGSAAVNLLNELSDEELSKIDAVYDPNSDRENYLIPGTSLKVKHSSKLATECLFVLSSYSPQLPKVERIYDGFSFCGRFKGG